MKFTIVPEVVWLEMCLNFIELEDLVQFAATCKFFWIIGHMAITSLRNNQNPSKGKATLPSLVLTNLCVSKCSLGDLIYLCSVFLALTKSKMPDLESIQRIIPIGISCGSLFFQPIDRFLLPARYFHHQSLLQETVEHIICKIEKSSRSDITLFLKFISCVKGIGVFTKTVISKGSALAIYFGEIIPKRDAQMRYAQYDKEGLNYILIIKELTADHEFTMTSCFDATKYGNEARFINHSCQPNAMIEMWRSEQSSLFGVPVVVATKTILPGEEITISYADTITDSNITPDSKKSKFCMCGSSTCSGILPQAEI